MSTCTCYFCDGTGETADGYDDQFRSRSDTCRHCGGTGQEPEDREPDTTPYEAPHICTYCPTPNCADRGGDVLFCGGNDIGRITAAMFRPKLDATKSGATIAPETIGGPNV